MAERAGATVRPTVASFVTPGPFAPGRLTLGEDAAQHARVRRLAEGERVTLRDGAGGVADARVVRIDRRALDVEVTHVAHADAPPAVHLLAPVGDRDRMLWLAEKAVEIGIASWRAVRWQRSRSVSPRGEGEAFVAKLRARMAQAVAQSDGAWLPEVHDAADFADVVAALPAGARVVLDGEGGPISAVEAGAVQTGVVVALGPEGGLEVEEFAACDAAGFRRVRLPGNVLRFETAGVVGVAFASAAVEASRGARA